MTTYNFDVEYTEGGQTAVSAQTLKVYDNLKSELLFNGANGSTTITDSTGRAWTRSGNAQLATAQKAEGTASLLLDGSGDYLSTPSTADIQCTGDFRIECSIRPAVVNAVKVIASKRPFTGATGAEFMFGINATGVLFLQVWDGSSLVISGFNSTTALVANASFYDVAVWRLERPSLQPLYGFEVNGVTEATQVQSAANAVGTENLIIGRDVTTPARDFNGYIDRFRFLRP